MRQELKKLEGSRIKVTGKVGRFGKKTAYKGPDLDTICLIELKDSEGKMLCDHIWLTVGKQIKSLDLVVGDIISFEARSKEYLKGYFGRRDDVYKEIETDYKLSNPTKFQKLM